MLDDGSTTVREVSGQPEFVRLSSQEIHDVLGVPVIYVLSDMPWTFHVVAGGGERAGSRSASFLTPSMSTSRCTSMTS